MVRVAINGFGRIGRLFFRAAHKELDIVAINDLGDIPTMAHLLKHDSAHGKFEATIESKEKTIIVDGKEIQMYSEREPENLPWKDLNIDIVVESTGFFVKKELAEKHLTAGAKKVLLSAPAKGGNVKTIVLGVNEKTYNPEEDHIISNASCTTNCLAPLLKVIQDEIGIKRGLMTTIHAYTGDQRIVDTPHKDLRRARAAGVNIIPTTTGAAIAVGLVIPELAGKLDGMAVRVPVIDGSLTDATLELNRETTIEEVKELYKKAAQGKLKGILEYSEEPLVSKDIIGNQHSSIFDATLTKIIEGNQIKLVSWYDNEWGYSNRLVDVIKLMIK